MNFGPLLVQVGVELDTAILAAWVGLGLTSLGFGGLLGLAVGLMTTSRKGGGYK